MDCEAVGGVGSSEFVQVGESEGGGLGGEPQTLKPSHTLVAPSLPLTERDKRVRVEGSEVSRRPSKPVTTGTAQSAAHLGVKVLNQSAGFALS